jgi:hypothetical protein
MKGKKVLMRTQTAHRRLKRPKETIRRESQSSGQKPHRGGRSKLKEKGVWDLEIARTMHGAFGFSPQKHEFVLGFRPQTCYLDFAQKPGDWVSDSWENVPKRSDSSSWSWTDFEMRLRSPPEVWEEIAPKREVKSSSNYNSKSWRCQCFGNMFIRNLSKMAEIV